MITVQVRNHNFHSGRYEIAIEAYRAYQLSNLIHSFMLIVHIADLSDITPPVPVSIISY